MNPDLYIELVRQINSLQKQVDGLVKPEVSLWVDWTPTVTQSGAVAATVTHARYSVLGNVVTMYARLAVTGAGVANNAIVISGVPTTIQPLLTTACIGSFFLFDSGTAFYVGAVTSQGVNDFRFFAHNQTNVVGISPNFALANGDVIVFQATYER